MLYYEQENGDRFQSSLHMYDFIYHHHLTALKWLTNDHIKSLGVIIQQKLYFELHVFAIGAVVKGCI